MDDRHLHLGCHDSSAHRRIDITHHDYAVSVFGNQHTLESLHDLSRLLSMRSRSDPQPVIWLGQIEITKEAGGELIIVVLSGVDENAFERIMAVEFLKQRPHFHEIRTSSCNEY